MLSLLLAGILSVLTSASLAQTRGPIASAQSHTCGWGSFHAAKAPGSCWRPFGNHAWLNRPLARSAKLRPNSRAYVDRLMDSGDGQVRGLHPITTRGNDWYHPYFFSKRSSPAYRIDCTRGCVDPDDGDLQGRRVRVPCGARPATGTDKHMAVIDQRTGIEWDFFEVQTNLKRCKGGRLRVGTAGRVAIDGHGRQSCATAACIPLTAGVIRLPELAAGSINHALFMVNGVDCDGPAVFPAPEGATCYRRNRRGIPQGQVFRLHRTPAQINALTGIAGWQKTILHAMARYGMVVGDQGSNGSFELQTESHETYRGGKNPWRAWARRQEAKPGSNVHFDARNRLFLDFAAGIPESYFRQHLRALDPCAVERTC